MSSPSLTDTSPETRRPGRPRDERAEPAILRAAIDLVSAEGLAAVTVDAIAAAAGVSKATIYRRWRSKEALLLDAWRRLKVPVPAPDTGSVREDLIAHYCEFVRKMRSGDLARVLPQMVAAAQVDPELAREYRAVLAERRRPLLTIIERAVARGELPADIDPTVVQELITGPLYYRAVVVGRSVPRAHIERLVDLVLTGLRAGAWDTAEKPA